MKWLDEDERLPISMIKQYAYCKRRFSLMFIDNQWAGNYKIAEGDITHAKVDDPFFNEKRGDVHNSRSVPVYSDALNLYGIADIIEFIKDDNGVKIDGKKGLWRINPIEYKNGKPEKSNADNYQLGAVAMCLEEIFCCKIKSGDIYYNKLHRRFQVDITDDIKDDIKRIILDIKSILHNDKLIAKSESQYCGLCSLKNICLPKALDKKLSNKKRVML